MIARLRFRLTDFSLRYVDFNQIEMDFDPQNLALVAKKIAVTVVGFYSFFFLLSSILFYVSLFTWRFSFQIGIDFQAFHRQIHPIRNVYNFFSLRDQIRINNSKRCKEDEWLSWRIEAWAFEKMNACFKSRFVIRICLSHLMLNARFSTHTCKNNSLLPLSTNGKRTHANNPN